MEQTPRPSIWDSARFIEPTEKPRLETVHDDGLRDVLHRGLTLVLIGRNSGSSGRAGCRRAAIDLHEAADELHHRTGFDVRPSLPAPEALAEWLFDSSYKVTSQTDAGERFLNRFLLVSLTGANVVLSISAGSALKVNVDYAQPHAEHLKRVLLDDEVGAGGFFAKRFDRLVRSTWATGVVLESLRTLDRRNGLSWAGDGELGRWSIDDPTDILFAARGSGARAEGLAIAKKRARSLQRLTGDEMVGGRVPYAVGTGIPPGLMRYRDRQSRVAYLAIDSPEFYGRQDDCLGLPNVRDAAGDLVDQAATVQWLLSQWGKPGRPDADLVDELAERRYSTHAYRQRRSGGGAAGFYGEPKGQYLRSPLDVAGIIRGFVNNLDLYETGELVRRVGGVERTIRNVFPTGGAWATAEDFERIRGHLAAQSERNSSRNSWSWGGLRVVVDGEACRMLAKPRASADGGEEVAWGFEPDVPQRRTGRRRGRLVSDERSDSPRLTTAVEDLEGGLVDDGLVDVERRERARRIPAVPDRVLTAAILKGVIEANGRPLLPFLTPTEISKARAKDLANRNRLEASLRSLEDVQAAQEAMLLAGGDQAMGPALRAKALKAFEDRNAQIEDLLRDLVRRDRMLEASVAQSRGVSVDVLAEVLNGIRNPRSSRYRQALREAIHGLSFITCREIRRDRVGVKVDFAGQLLVEHRGSTWTVGFAGDYAVGAVHEEEARTLTALTRLRKGHVARGVGRGQVKVMNGRVAEMLGVPSKSLAIANCHDSDLLRIGMAALFPDPVPGESLDGIATLDELAGDQRLVADFGDIRALASRIRSAYEDCDSATWLTIGGGQREVGLILESAEQSEPPYTGDRYADFGKRIREAGRGHRWTLKRGHRPTFIPCRWCGSRLCSPSRLREVSGYVCLNADCRRDDAGVRWPRRFDAYLSRPSMWVEAGLDLSLPPGFTGKAADLKGASDHPIVAVRAIAEIPPEAVESMIAAYRDGTVSVSEVARLHGVTVGSLYNVLRKHGIAFRAGPSVARRRAG